MPLIHGKSKKDFSHNVEAEMSAGKPMKQSLAIAYAMKRKAHKMAEGGMLTNDGYQSECDEHCVDESHEHMNEKASGYMDHAGNDVKHNSMAMHEDDRDLNQHGEHEVGPMGAYADGGFIEDNYQDKSHEMDMVGRIMKQREQCYSEGGHVDSGKSDEEKRAARQERHPVYISGGPGRADSRHGKPGEAYSGVHRPWSGGKSSDRQWDEKVNRGGTSERKMTAKHNLGEGKAASNYPKHFSQGGRVANEDMPMADFEDNSFDDLANRDDLEFHDTSANSGDEKGNSREAKDRADMVSRIMNSRKKKDRMPHPA